MNSSTYRSALSPARRLGVLGALGATLLLVAGCVTAGASASPSTPLATPAPTPTPTPATPTPTPTPTPIPTGPSAANGFYLRAWRTQALAPQYTFAWLPVATISDGKFIDGMVAIPTIYPGPLWAGPSVRSISAAGIDAIVAEARKLGLLTGNGDFTGNSMPGSQIGHIQMVVDGKTYDLAGDPDALTRCMCTAAPGTSSAFASFWLEITQLATWIPTDLGQSAAYEPDRLAVLATPPTDAVSGVTSAEATWPLATPFSKFGTAMGNVAFRCGVVSGADLAKLLPLVKQSNQLTRFKDSAGVKDSLQVRVLVPSEPSPCAP